MTFITESQIDYRELNQMTAKQLPYDPTIPETSYGKHRRMVKVIEDPDAVEQIQDVPEELSAK